MDAVVAFQHWLAVPRTAQDQAAGANGAALFAAAGCAACHLPELPTANAGSLRAYTDLLLHDLGKDLADRRADGRPIASAWRTAPLWGLGHAVRSGRPLALLHDGRARSVEEAILWHDGTAAKARLRFQRLSERERGLLIQWVGEL